MYRVNKMKTDLFWGGQSRVLGCRNRQTVCLTSRERGETL